ncbi:hypothetical protein M0R45_006159 [Rubus argutus]|uniref:Uncharacterized protein n=1 Tax=Rubus argutus TaxID=59490 RepID=A0AAW1YQ05_RUBAR
MFAKRDELKITGLSIQNTDVEGSDDEVQPPSDIDHNRSTTFVSIIPSREDKTVKKGFKHNSSNGSVENSSIRQKAGVSTTHKVVSNSALHHQILQVPQPSISVEEVTVNVPVGNANQKMVEDGPLKDKTLFGDFEVFVQEGVGRGSQSTSVGSEGNNVVIMQGRVGDWKRKARAMASPNMSDNFAGVGGKRPNDNMLIDEKLNVHGLQGLDWM